MQQNFKISFKIYLDVSDEVGLFWYINSKVVENVLSLVLAHIIISRMGP